MLAFREGGKEKDDVNSASVVGGDGRGDGEEPNVAGTREKKRARLNQEGEESCKVGGRYCTDLYGSNVTRNAGLKMLPKTPRNAEFWAIQRPIGQFFRACGAEIAFLGRFAAK